MSFTKNVEYASMATSVLGAIIAMATHQLAYFVAPATVSLALNLTNRQREFSKHSTQVEMLEKAMYHHNNFTAKEISDVKISLHQLPSSPSISKLEKLNSSTVKNQLEIGEIGLELAAVKQKNILKSNEIISSLNQLGRDFLDFKKETSSNHIIHRSRITEIDSLAANINNKIDAIHPDTVNLSVFSTELDNRLIEIVDKVVGKKNIDQLIQKEIDQCFEILKQSLPKEYSYDLIHGRQKSRSVFIDALKQSKTSLFLICPWISSNALKPDIKDLILKALERDVSISLGWGHLADVDNKRNLLSKDGLLTATKDKDGKISWKYDAINWFYDLQKKYPRLITIKTLGTHEKFLICDEKFAMIGSHNFMCSGDRTSRGISQEREIGVRTTNLQTIRDLADSFNMVNTEDKKMIGILN